MRQLSETILYNAEIVLSIKRPKLKNVNNMIMKPDSRHIHIQSRKCLIDSVAQMQMTLHCFKLKTKIKLRCIDPQLVSIQRARTVEYLVLNGIFISQYFLLCNNL